MQHPVFNLPIGRIFAFSPTGAKRCTDDIEIWRGTIDLDSSTPNFTFVGAEWWDMGPQKQ